MKNIKVQIIQVLAPNIKYTSQLQCIKETVFYCLGSSQVRLLSGLLTSLSQLLTLLWDLYL